VFVTKLTAVFQASAGGTPVTLFGLRKRCSCTRCSAYRSTTPTTLNASNDIA
jgi:hypothetical protein